MLLLNGETVYYRDEWCSTNFNVWLMHGPFRVINGLVTVQRLLWIIAINHGSMMTTEYAMNAV